MGHTLKRTDLWRWAAGAFGALFMAAFVVGTASGQALKLTNLVQAGEVIDNDVLLTGYRGTIDGRVIGNVFATGPEITVNGDIEGSLFVIGDKVTVNGDVRGGTYVLGVSLEQGASSTIDLNLYFLGISLRTAAGSEIGRDLILVALSANLAGEVGRDTRAVVGLLELARLIGEAISMGVRGKSVELSGAGAPSTVGAVGTAGGILARSKAAPEIALQPAVSDEIVEIAVNCLQALVSFLIVGGLVIWVLPSFFEQAVAKVRKRPLASAGFGALVFVNGFLLTALLAILILAVGLGLRALTLTGLAWGFWGVAFSSLGLAFSIFVVSVVWLSKAIVAFLVGFLIFNRYYPRALEYRLVPLLLGLAIYILLCPLPILGWTIALLVTFLGLGGLFLAGWEKKPASVGGRRGGRKKK